MDPFAIIDDNTIPEETKVYYIKGKRYIQNFILIVALAIGVYFALLPNNDNERIFGLILSGLAIIFLYVNAKLNENKEPQIIINSKGIQMNAIGFKSWKDISSATIDTVNTGEFLVYDHLGEQERFFIGNLDVRRDRLAYLLNIYRYRHELQQSRYKA